MVWPAAPAFAEQLDQIVSADWCLHVAADEWSSKGCYDLADLDSVTRVTRAINGGLVSIAERTEWLERTKAVWS